MIKIAKLMIEFITEDNDFKNLYGILLTSDAHGLYQQYGFERETETFMHKRRIMINGDQHIVK
jgi:hypothetical protein